MHRLFCVLAVVNAWPMVAAGAEDFHRFVLIDSKANQRVVSKTLSPKDFDGASTDVKWSVNKAVLHGGKQEGVDIITVDNGKMSIRILPTRGMSILDATVGDFRLGWESPVQEVVHPSYVDLDTRGGLGWLDGFNEWMVRCGLEFAGHPGVDTFITNTGDESEMMLTLHGKVGNIPASQVEVRIEKQAPHRIIVRGTVHERMFFGPKLELVTEIATTPGSTELTITDRVTNRGADEQEIMLIYHTNYGTPLLEAGATFVAPVKTLAPMNETAISGLDKYNLYSGPTAGYLEQVYLAELFADQQNTTVVSLLNSDRSRAASITYNIEQLPYFTLWKNTTSKDNGYVTGLEPGTCHPFNRHVERKFGRVPKLKAGKTREFSLTFGLHSGQSAVDSLVDRIRKLQTEEPEVSRTPPEHN